MELHGFATGKVGKGHGLDKIALLSIINYRTAIEQGLMSDDAMNEARVPRDLLRYQTSSHIAIQVQLINSCEEHTMIQCATTCNYFIT